MFSRLQGQHESQRVFALRNFDINIGGNRDNWQVLCDKDLESNRARFHAVEVDLADVRTSYRDTG